MHTILNLIRWIFGIFFCLAAIGGLMKGDVVQALFVMALGLLLIPGLGQAVFGGKAPAVDTAVPQAKPYSSALAEAQKEKQRREMLDREQKKKEMQQRQATAVVIDVSGESYKIKAQEPPRKVPYWSHQYVYAYSELEAATKEQKEFYAWFRQAFLEDNFIDLEGNFNYAFILFFDLLSEYDYKHRNLSLLEKQLASLGQHYPKTKSYAISELVKRMKAAGDHPGLLRWGYREVTEVCQPYEYHSGLGKKFKSKLGLTEEEVKHFNTIWYGENNFCEMEQCYLELLRLYVNILRELKEIFAAEEKNFTAEVKALTDLVIRKHYRYRSGSENYLYATESVTRELHISLLRICENALREHYGHKRKIATEFYTNVAEVRTLWEERFVQHSMNALPGQLAKVLPPDEATEVALNERNTSRWKIAFEFLTGKKTANAQAFMEQVLQLGRLNRENPSVELIFFEASKFISKTDKQAALSLYLHYLWHDLRSATFDNRALTKTIQKNLFKTQEQLHAFECIVAQLVKDKDLDKALQAADMFYAPKRRKIVLNDVAILEEHQKHAETVELLNEYLQDEYEDEHSIITATQVSTDELSLAIVPRQAQPAVSFLLHNPGLNAAQGELMELFVKSSFTLAQQDAEQFARSKGLFKNPLVESINEAYYELLDDVLIEEEDEQYIISEIYQPKVFVL